MINIILLPVSLILMIHGLITHDLTTLVIGATIGLTLTTLHKRSLSGELPSKPLEHDAVIYGYNDYGNNGE